MPFAESTAARRACPCRTLRGVRVGDLWEGDVSDAKVERLRQIPLFKSCNGHALSEIAQLADEVDVADGYTLIREGTFGEQFILIIDGHVRIDRGGRTVRAMGPGEFLGEIALIDKGRTT